MTCNTLKARLVRLEAFAVVEARDGYATRRTLAAEAGCALYTVDAWLRYGIDAGKLTRVARARYVLTEGGHVDLAKLRSGPQPVRRVTHTEYMRDYRARQRQNGCCADCGKQSERYRCTRCRSRQSRRWQRRQEAA